VSDAACGTGLLRDVIDHPGDDTPRLIYADWLEDNPGGCRFPAHAAGRAELIRVQVELERLQAWAAKQFLVLPESPKGQRIEALRRREEELLDAVGYHAVHHLADEPTAIIIGKERIGIRRGFVGAWNMTLSQWLEHGPGLVRRHPLTRVKLTDRAGWFGWFDDASGLDKEDLPHDLWDLLAGFRPCGLTFWKFYGSEKDAVDALSAALIAWAKEQKP
jgi:uncharacterized protein (TIGR02996 family)